MLCPTGSPKTHANLCRVIYNMVANAENFKTKYTMLEQRFDYILSYNLIPFEVEWGRGHANRLLSQDQNLVELGLKV